MRIECVQDLESAWQGSTLLGKIFYFWLFALGFIALTLICFYTMGVVNFGHWAGFFINDESEEN